MTRLHGRSLRGKRLVGKRPHGQWRTTTMISSIWLNGTAACMTIKGATDTQLFRSYVRVVPSPKLRTGDMVVMDKLGAHKNEETLSLTREVGATAHFLPAHSPELNPIEMMWSKVKSILRRL